MSIGTENQKKVRIRKFLFMAGVAIIAVILIRSATSTSSFDPCEAAENVIKNCGYNVSDSKVMGDVNSDLEMQGFSSNENNLWYIAVKAHDDGSNTYILSLIVSESSSDESLLSSVKYLGAESASGTFIGLSYENIPDSLNSQTCQELREEMDSVVQSYLQ